MSDTLVIVCTRDRPGDVRRCLDAVFADRPSQRVLVVDASDGDETRTVCEQWPSLSSGQMRYEPAPQPGLAKQRNHALGLLHGESFIHFLDDDTEILPGYLEAIEETFSLGEYVGVGGVVVDQPPAHFIGVKALFALYSRRPGRILRSGRNTIGHYEAPHGGVRHVQWLPGCAMSYRVSALDGLRFDDRLQGYSWGEDFDFSFRLGERGPLAIALHAKCKHSLSPLNRMQVRALARERTLILRRWVAENARRGLSVRLFWWSVLGELLLRGVESIKVAESRQMVLGIFDAVVEVIKSKRRTRLC